MCVRARAYGYGLTMSIHVQCVYACPYRGQTYFHGSYGFFPANIKRIKKEVPVV